MIRCQFEFYVCKIFVIEHNRKCHEHSFVRNIKGLLIIVTLYNGLVANKNITSRIIQLFAFCESGCKDYNAPERTSINVKSRQTHTTFKDDEFIFNMEFKSGVRQAVVNSSG